jgi:hypothetical protein
MRMISRVSGMVGAAFLAVLIFSAALHAATYDFEDGTDGQTITAPDANIVFEPNAGNLWVYGDWTTDNYNGPYPNGSYFSDGDFFAWMGANVDKGKISFPNGATKCSIEYSAFDVISLEAYSATGNMVDSDTGVPNLSTGEMGLLEVEADSIAWVMVAIGGVGNYWIIDNIFSDAIVGCLGPEDCTDNIWCNGEELCIAGDCQPGIAPSCAEDNNLFCDGEETCNEDLKQCDHTGDPCPPDTECDEDLDKCVQHGALSDDTEEPVDSETPGWPEGKVTGGCCGCE